MPREISKVAWFFLGHKGTGSEITGLMRVCSCRKRLCVKIRLSTLSLENQLPLKNTKQTAIATSLKKRNAAFQIRFQDIFYQSNLTQGRTVIILLACKALESRWSMSNHHTKHIPSQVRSHPYTEVGLVSTRSTKFSPHRYAEQQKTMQSVEKALWSCVYSIVT